MGYKEQLKKVIQQFNQLKDTAVTTIKSVRESNNFTAEYKDELIKVAKQDCVEQQDKLTKEALVIIEAARNEILKGKTAAEKDQSFDLKLSNALKIIGIVGPNMTVEELRTLIEPFQEDYHTMKILRNIFLKGGIKGVDEIFGYDTIDHNVSKLDELERYINQIFRGDIETTNTMKLSICLDMMIE